MNAKKIFCGTLCTIVILLILLFILLVFNDQNKKYNKLFSHTKNTIIDNFDNNLIKQKYWKRNSKCKYIVTPTIAQVLKDYNINEAPNNKFHMYLPCNYNDIKGEIKDILNKKYCDSEYYFIVSNADELTGKDKIWKNLKLLYGDKASIIMPKTYVLYDKIDMHNFNKEYDPTKIYILKKNIQRQEGLKITKNKKEINDGLKNKYVIAQELLQDPLIIDNRKTNMRFYLLLVCENGNITAYLHDEGFMYYTSKNFKKNSIDHDVNITTGYIDRKVYDNNPLTLGDFRNYIDNNYKNSNINITSTQIFNRILEVINKLVQAIGFTVCQDKNLFKCNTFQIFGVDVALNDNFIPQIMEVNKGPDLGGKDERDLSIKKKVVVDMLNIVGIIPEIKNNQFHKVYPKIEYYLE